MVALDRDRLELERGDPDLSWKQPSSRGAVPELTEVVPARAVALATLSDNACVGRPGSDLRHVRRVQTRRNVPIRRRPIPELSLRVLPPAERFRFVAQVAARVAIAGA